MVLRQRRPSLDSVWLGNLAQRSAYGQSSFCEKKALNVFWQPQIVKRTVKEFGGCGRSLGIHLTLVLQIEKDLERHFRVDTVAAFE